MKICILGPVNPADLRNYLNNPDSVWNSRHSFGSVVALIKGLIDQGHELFVISADKIEKDILTFDGYNLHVRIVNTTPPFPLAGFFFFDKFVPQRIADEIKKIIDEIDVIHAQWTYEYAVATLKYADYKPTFCTVRDWYPYIKQFTYSIRNFFFLLAKGRMFKKVMSSKKFFFIANSEYTRNLLKVSIKQDLPVIYNPVASDFFVSNGEIQTCPIFLTIAQDLDEKRKNISLLLHAFRNVLNTIPDAKLILVGAYSSQGVYKEALNLQLGDKVVFRGPVSRELLKIIIDKSRIYVHPALEETFGNVLLEAMVRQKPVIGGCDSGAVPYVLKGGEQGILCNILSSDELSNAMIDLHQNDQKYMEIVKKNQEYVKRFKDDFIAAEHYKLYISTAK